MLTLTLKGLERDGLVTRMVFPTVPPRVDYALTRLGKALLQPVLALAAWAEKNRFAIQAARDRFDKNPQTSGRQLRALTRPAKTTARAPPPVSRPAKPRTAMVAR